MNWNNILLRHSEMEAQSADWPGRINRLFEHQIQHWPLLRRNIQRLDSTRTKRIPQGNFEILAQYNSERRHSTTAKVDPASVRQRPCKLCPENLFSEQRGLAYGDELVILCNPYPILRRHLSIVHRSHLKQAIHGRLPLLLNLAQDLGDSFFLFYNGPQCGASAPDHFHVQACARDKLPVLQHLKMVDGNGNSLQTCKQEIGHADGMQCFTLIPYHARVLVYRGTDDAALIAWIDRTLSVFAKLANALDEPLLNIVAWYDAAQYGAEQWTICLFPRATHRPACYYDGTLIVSPASLDMAGLLVFPFQEHVESLTPEDVTQVYTEVSLSPALFSNLLHNLVTS